MLSEILIRRMGNNHLGFISPGFTDYQPMGIVPGADLPPDYSVGGNGLFSDNFESGNTNAWSTTTP